MNGGVEERGRWKNGWSNWFVCSSIRETDSSKINLLIWMYVSKCNGLMYNISCSTIISLRTAELPIQEIDRERSLTTVQTQLSITFKLEIFYTFVLERKRVKKILESNWNAYKNIRGKVLYRGRILISSTEERRTLFEHGINRGKMIKL